MINTPSSIQENFWTSNEHLTLIKPFSTLYNNDKSKDKLQSSKDMWCILWLSHPDEEENKYYRLPEQEKLEVCKEYNKTFDVEDSIIVSCIEKFPELFDDSITRAYKESKDQLIEISRFLNTQKLTLEDAGEIIKLKSLLPKLFQEFDKLEQQFKKSKSQQRVHGGRAKTQRERNRFIPEN